MTPSKPISGIYSLISPNYALIATGDLGRVGHRIAADLLDKHGLALPPDRFIDCGLLIYKKEQPVLAGGSRCACSATVTYRHLLNGCARVNYTGS